LGEILTCSLIDFLLYSFCSGSLKDSLWLKERLNPVLAVFAANAGLESGPRAPEDRPSRYFIDHHAAINPIESATMIRNCTIGNKSSEFDESYPTSRRRVSAFVFGLARWQGVGESANGVGVSLARNRRGSKRLSEPRPSSVHPHEAEVGQNRETRKV